MSWLTWVDDLGEYELDDPNGVLIQELRGLNAAPVTLRQSRVLNGDGARTTHRRYEARTLEFELDFYHPTRVRTVIKALLDRVDRGGVLRYDDGTVVRELLDVERFSGLHGDEVSNNRFAQDDLVLVAGDPWWYGQRNVEPLNFGNEAEWDSPDIEYDDTTVFWGGASSKRLVVLGDEPALPEFTIVGPFETLAVVVGDRSFSLSGPLASGDTIDIITRPGGAGPRLNRGPVEWGLIATPRRFFELDVGDLDVVVQSTGFVDGESMVEIRWRERHRAP